MAESQMKKIVEANKYKFIAVGKGDQKVLIFEVPDVGEDGNKKYLTLSKRNGFKFAHFQSPSGDGVISDGAETFWSHVKKYSDELEDGMGSGLQQDKDNASVAFHGFGFSAELSPVDIYGVERLRDLNTKTQEDEVVPEKLADDAMEILRQADGLF